jgi:hypothetical protein
MWPMLIFIVRILIKLLWPMVIALFTIVVDDKVITRIGEKCQFSAKRLEGLLRYACVIRFFSLNRTCTFDRCVV